ncbi:MAG: hypothetical protein JKY88_16765 [Pseudomonadales bacterium]|nr:hypothetical protein [Pseudomonadales bacterium]
MRIVIMILFMLLAGCSSGIYHVPTKEYQQQVKTLGVLPLMVDRRSVIVHPDATQILDLLDRSAAGRSAAVVDELRKKKGYFDVRLVREPARVLAEKLLIKADVDELGLPRGYRLNPQFLAELCKDSFVDGLLLLNLQAVVHNDKRWSRNTFETLITDYNDIMATASVVAADGRVLWEMNGADATTILPLQYPDFDEAYFNKETAVGLKFIGIAGLEKTLLPAAEKEQEKPQSAQITAWLKKVTAALSPTLFR